MGLKVAIAMTGAQAAFGEAWVLYDWVMLTGLKVAIALTCVQAAFGETWVVYGWVVLIGIKVTLMPLWQLL